jgi:DNA-binding SARP family transcriptional activator
VPELWKVGLLGGFTIERGGRLHTVAAASQRLVAYVALHGPSPRTLVAGNLWPEAPEEHALASLRTGVWRVKRALPELLSVDVDCLRQKSVCRRLMGTGHLDTGWLDDHLHCLWSGDLLPGWYDDWVVDERELLRQLRLHALERSARIFIRDGRLDLALALALEAVRAEPLRESANSVLISVHLAEGNVVDAVRRFEHFRDHLLREVGVDPSPRMTNLLPRTIVSLDSQGGRGARS